MLKSSHLKEEQDDSMGQEIADQIEDGMESVVKAILSLKDLKLPEPNIQVNVPKHDPLPIPKVELKAEFPDQKPHPFSNGLICEIVSRGSKGEIQKFTLKPISP